MTVSVIIPCFSAEAYIAETLRSVLVRTYRDIDNIVVDDARRLNYFPV